MVLRRGFFLCLTAPCGIFIGDITMTKHDWIIEQMRPKTAFDFYWDLFFGDCDLDDLPDLAESTAVAAAFASAH